MKELDKRAQQEVLGGSASAVSYLIGIAILVGGLVARRVIWLHHTIR